MRLESAPIPFSQAAPVPVWARIWRRPKIGPAASGAPLCPLHSARLPPDGANEPPTPSRGQTGSPEPHSASSASCAAAR